MGLYMRARKHAECCVKPRGGTGALDSYAWIWVGRTLEGGVGQGWWYPCMLRGPVTFSQIPEFVGTTYSLGLPPQKAIKHA